MITLQRNIILLLKSMAPFSTAYKCLANIARKGWNLIEIFLVTIIFILFITFTSYYINHLVTIDNYHSHPLKVLVYFILGIAILYNIIFNYVMCNRLGPGHPSQLQTMFPNFSAQVQRRCQKCSSRKPVRSHHCSVCEKCNLQMDHHCPWMGTCIGHNNRQYFINFLTYVALVAIVYICMMLDFHMKKRETYYFMFSISLVIGLFSLFHWIIALFGRTTLEVCQILDGYTPSHSISINFQIIFGTKNVFMALLPICRQLQYKGYEWECLERSPQITSQTNIQQQILN